MRVALLTEGGPQIGLGHLRRCATLAGALAPYGSQPAFYIAGDKSADRYLKGLGFSVNTSASFPDACLRLVADASSRDVVVVDSYSASDSLLAQFRPVRVVIDDLANRSTPAELLINSALGAEPEMYEGLTEATLLLGPRYSLVRPGFAGGNELPRVDIQHILVTLGGGEMGQLAQRVVQWCLDLAPNARILFAVGPFAAAPTFPVSSRISIQHNLDMATAMNRADVAVTGGGQTLFELAAAGLPALVIEVAANQQSNVTGFTRAGTVIRVGRVDDSGLEEQFISSFAAISDRHTRTSMRNRGRRLVDNQGAERVAAEIARQCERILDR